MKRNIMATLLAAVLLTGCDTMTVKEKHYDLDGYRASVDKCDEMLKLAEASTTRKKASQLKLTLSLIDGKDFLRWESILGEYIYDMRAALHRRGYTDLDMGVTHDDGMPAVLPCMVHSKVAMKMKQLVIDTGMGKNPREVEVMLRKYGTVLLYNVLAGELEGKERLQVLSLPNVDLRDHRAVVSVNNKWVKVNTEYAFNDTEFASIVMTLIVRKHSLNLMSQIAAQESKHTAEWRKYGGSETKQTTEGVYAYLGNTNRDRAYKRVLTWIHGSTDIINDYYNKNIVAANAYYRNYNLQYTF